MPGLQLVVESHPRVAKTSTQWLTLHDATDPTVVYAAPVHDARLAAAHLHVGVAYTCLNTGVTLTAGADPFTGTTLVTCRRGTVTLWSATIASRHLRLRTRQR